MSRRDIVLTTELQSTESLIYLFGAKSNLYVVSFPLDSLVMPSAISSDCNKLTMDLDGCKKSGLQLVYVNLPLP